MTAALAPNPAISWKLFIWKSGCMLKLKIVRKQNKTNKNKNVLDIIGQWFAFLVMKDPLKFGFDSKGTYCCTHNIRYNGNKQVFHQNTSKF